MKLFYLKYMLLLIIVLVIQQLTYANRKHVININTLNYDGTNRGIQPGDTIWIEPGVRECLRLFNIHGDSLNPVVIINDGGIVEISSLISYLGITIRDCTYFKLTGTGSSDATYGILVSKTKIGTSGVSLNGTSSNYEVENIEICNSGFAGFFVNQPPDCENKLTRDNFVIQDISFHDNYIHNTKGEGFYVGHSFYTGYTVYCDSVKTLLYPPEIHDIKIYNNILDSIGSDGIQVGCATKGCEIYNNKILHYGVENESFQQTGIQISAGTGGKCYNNLIMNGTGSGIHVFGIGGNKIFNNIIVNPGYSLNDTTLSPNASGIFFDDRSTLADSSFYFLNNVIISPKRDGIRINSKKSKINIIYNNIILNPGSYGTYRGHLAQMNSFVNIPIDVKSTISNNYFAKSLSPNLDPYDINEIYNYIGTLPIIDNGIDIRKFGIDVDFWGNSRVDGTNSDIGAFEYDEVFKWNQQQTPIIRIHDFSKDDNDNIFSKEQEFIIQVILYDLAGRIIYNYYPNSTIYNLDLDSNLKRGIYILHIISNRTIKSKKILVSSI